MLPDISGIEVCRQIKSKPQTRSIPVIMLTARGEEDDKVRGLDVGVDDFVVKPHLRRGKKIEPELSYVDIVMNTETHRVSRGGRNIKFGPTEFRLLKTFLQRPQKVWSRAALLDYVWGTDSHVDDCTGGCSYWPTSQSAEGGW